MEWTIAETGHLMVKGLLDGPLVTLWQASRHKHRILTAEPLWPTGMIALP